LNEQNVWLQNSNLYSIISGGIMTYKVTYISASSASRIDRMNRASNDVFLGHTIQALQSASATNSAVATSASTVAGLAYAALSASGSYAVVSAEATASRVVITTGLAAVKGEVVQVRRSGSSVMPYYNVIAGSVAGTLDMRNVTGALATSSSKILADDLVTWMVF
jgi:hypothetical protein